MKKIMKKIIKKICAFLVSIWVFLSNVTIATTTNFNANNSITKNMLIYEATDTSAAYGTSVGRIGIAYLNIIRAIVIPFIAIVGIIAYLNKSKSSKKRKIIIVISILAIAIILIYAIGIIVRQALSNG